MYRIYVDESKGNMVYPVGWLKAEVSAGHSVTTTKSKRFAIAFDTYDEAEFAANRVERAGFCANISGFQTEGME